MLLQLPQEVLFDIIDFLAFQDRLNLVKTCRHLNNVISEEVLFEELPTFRNYSTLRAALDAFKKYPFRGLKVKRISISDYLYTVEISVELPSVFPAIKEFRTVKTWMAYQSPEVETLLPWKNTLEVFDGGSQANISYLLRDHLFSCLSFLTICVPRNYYEITYIDDMIDCLKNTPSLRHLKICDLRDSLYLKHLEKLHEVCPQLTSLCLTAMNMHASDIGTMPSSIEPATQLLSFRVEGDVRIFDPQNAVLEYFIAKYTKLTQLVFLGKFTNDGYRFGISQENYCDELVRQRRWFISSLPATIKILQLNTDEYDDPLAALDESDLNPTELALYCTRGNDVIPSDVIKQPSQLRYLQSLKSLRSLTLGWNPGVEIDNIILDGVLHLKVQIMYGLSDNIVYHLDEIITTYPSLKSLSVMHSHTPSKVITFPGRYHQSKEMVHANLRKLSISTHVNPKVLESIPTLFPNLKELKVTFFYEPGGVDSDIVSNLDGCDLDILSLSLLNFNSKYYNILVYLHVKSLDTLKIYRVNVAEEREINFITEISEGEDTATMKKIRIICDNIKMLISMT